MTYAVDTSRGAMRQDLSRQWASRPDDQKFLSVQALRDAVYARSIVSMSETLERDKVHVIEHGDDLVIDAGGKELVPTNWTFSSMCSAAGAPAGYLSELPGFLAAANLEYSWQAHGPDEALFYRNDQEGTLRAITSPRYGRIMDVDVVDMVMKVTGDGTGDTRWKVPGVMDWGSMRYNPDVPVSKATTTLYASDRDVWLFLCDDKNPIEVGKLDNGDPDLMFRGFYVWNSEVGSRTFGIATMYLRAICANRCLWGVEGFSEVTFRHTSGAPDRFSECGPMLDQFADAKVSKVAAGVQEAKRLMIAKKDEEAVDWISRDFPRKSALAMVELHKKEEHRPVRSIWDAAQAATAFARSIPYEDQRVVAERKAGAWLDKVAKAA